MIKEALWVDGWMVIIGHRYSKNELSDLHFMWIMKDLIAFNKLKNFHIQHGLCLCLSRVRRLLRPVKIHQKVC